MSKPKKPTREEVAALIAFLDSIEGSYDEDGHWAVWVDWKERDRLLKMLCELDAAKPRRKGKR